MSSLRSWLVGMLCGSLALGTAAASSGVSSGYRPIHAIEDSPEIRERTGPAQVQSIEPLSRGIAHEARHAQPDH